MIYLSQSYRLMIGKKLKAVQKIEIRHKIDLYFWNTLVSMTIAAMIFVSADESLFQWF